MALMFYLVMELPTNIRSTAYIHGLTEKYLLTTSSEKNVSVFTYYSVTTDIPLPTITTLHHH